MGLCRDTNSEWCYSDTQNMQTQHIAEALTYNYCIFIEHSSFKQHTATKNNTIINNNYNCTLYNRSWWYIETILQ